VEVSRSSLLTNTVFSGRYALNKMELTTMV